MARTWVRREPPVFGNVDMEASRISSARAVPPRVATMFSVSASRGSVPSKMMSAPTRVRACSWMARWRFQPSEPMATSAATPRVSAVEKTSNRPRLRRLSRQAMRQTQGSRRVGGRCSVVAVEVADMGMAM